MNLAAANDDAIRNAVLHPDRAVPLVLVTDRNERGGRRPPPPADPHAEDPCPVTCLGHLDGKFYFLDSRGQRRDLSARALGSRNELLSLFLGDDGWLRRNYPKKITKKTKGDDGTETEQEVTIDFNVNRACGYFQAQCGAAGLYGDHVVIRKPGVWAGESGAPAVHCGDIVLLNNALSPIGTRTKLDRGRVAVWAAAAPTPRPSDGCDSSVGQALQEDLQNLWNFREAGGAIVVMGVLGTAYFGGAARWRSCAFLLGEGGCGKSKLLEVLMSCCPLHFYRNDVTKSGLEQNLNGRAMPCFLDESEKTGEPTAANALLDLVLTASGGHGLQGARGGADGVGRSFEVVSTIFMAATGAPEMKQTHLGRFALVWLDKPKAGDDHRADHDALAQRMREIAPRLWGRAIGAWDRYNAALTVFREALRTMGCEPREMDQLGAILAGWWILTHEGVPDARQGRAGVIALGGFLRTSEIVAEESDRARVLDRLLTTAITLDRSSARETIGELIRRVVLHNAFDPENTAVHGTGTAIAALGTHGIRVVRSDDLRDAQGRDTPRLGPHGIWVNTSAFELEKLFAASDWAAGRWRQKLLELPSAKRAKFNVRVGGVAQKALWISLDDLSVTDPAPG